MGKRTGKPNNPISPWKHRVKAQRRKEAEERNAIYRALSLQDRLKKLDLYGHRALKERAKIKALLDAQKETKNEKQKA